MGRFSLALLGLLILPVGRGLAGDYPKPAVPPGGELRSLKGELIAADALPTTPSDVVHGEHPVRFALPGLKEGCYRVGFVLETGIHLQDPFGHAEGYVLAVERGKAPLADVAHLRSCDEPILKAVRKPDEASKEWAAWFGFVESAAPVWLGPDDRVVLRSKEGRRVSAVWLRLLDRPCDRIAVGAETGALDNAFTHDHPPRIRLRVTNAGKDDWEGSLRFEVRDLLNEQTAAELLPCKVPAGQTIELNHDPKSPFGIFRVVARPIDGPDRLGCHHSSPLTFAHAPARLARDLPDDWPLATHHSSPSPILKAPMPGFKWYRAFIGWSALNPAKGEYNWKNLDATVADVKAVGGKVLLCLEGAPVWTNKRAQTEKLSVSHFAPDDWEDARRFARAVVDRYDRTVLAGVEPWNEPNANLRWNDTFESLVELHKIWFEETRRSEGRIRVVGISISPGHHVDYVEALTERGILKFCDVVAGHFYEETGCRNRLSPRNNLPLHVDLLRVPLLRERRILPIWDTESGMGWEGANGRPRPEGRMVSQTELVKALRARPEFESAEPWKLWPPASERRMAARAVSGMTSLLGHGVEKHFTFHPNWYSQDRALNLPWVAAGCLGSVLEQVDFHCVMPIAVNSVGGADDVGAIAYRLGKPGGKQVVVLWAERPNPKHPFPEGWADWLDPVPVQLPCAEGIEVSVQDMYLRDSKRIKAANYPRGAAVSIPVGEEPVFVWGWKFRDQ